MIFSVQSRNKKYYTVNTDDGTCSCSGFREQGYCRHFDWGRDIAKGGDKYRLSVVSAFQKEIRRGDAMLARLWARVLGRLDGFEAPGAMAQSLLFSETRNLRLLADYCENKYDLAGQFVYLTIARKVWELDIYKDRPKHLLAGFWAFRGNGWSWDLDTLQSRIKSYQSPDEAYEIMFVVQQRREFVAPFWDALTERATKTKNEILQLFLQVKPDSPYAVGVALELGIGYWSVEANEFDAFPPKPEVDFIPLFEDYAYDAPLPDFYSRMSASWSHARSNHLLKSDKVDLRWSGLMVGWCWRHACHAEHGSLKDKDGQDRAWTSVKVNGLVWDQALGFDLLRHKDLAQAIRDAGHNLG